MHLSLLLPLVGVVSFVLYRILNRIVVRRQNAAKARQLGCQEAPSFPSGGFLNLQHLKRLQAADAQLLFPDLLLERQEEMNRLHGRTCTTFKTGILGQTMMFTSDPKNIQAMLATQFNDFEIGPIRFDIMGAALGDGIFVQDGKKWEHSRAMLRPNFVREQVSDLDMEERHVQNLFKTIPVGKDGWTELTNIQQKFFRLTIDASTEFLFGESCNSQLSEAGYNSGKRAADTPDEILFSKNFDTAQLHMAKMFRFGDMHWLYNKKEFKENGRIINEFVDHYVQIALRQSGDAEKKGAANGKKEKYVFLEALSQQTKDPVELRAQILNILLAGRDTTASLLSWTFLEFLRHPDVYAKLRETILSNFGSYDDPTNITFATLKSCQYLQCVLNESLRLWSVVPGNGRRSIRPTTLPRGGGPDGQSPVFLPANMQVDYSIHVMHRRKDIWGEDANEFKPERFIGRKYGWEFLPFNGGPRICIGQQFAITEASYVIVRLLQKFDRIEAAPGVLDDPIQSFLTLTSCPGRPVTLKMHEAEA